MGGVVLARVGELWRRISSPAVAVDGIDEPELERWRLRLSVYFTLAMSTVSALPFFASTGHPELIWPCSGVALAFFVAYVLTRWGWRRLAVYCAVVPLCASLAFNTYNYGPGLFEPAYFIAISLAFLALERRDKGTLALVIVSCLFIAAVGSLLQVDEPPLALPPPQKAMLRAVTLLMVGCTFSLVFYYVTVVSYRLGQLQHRLDESEAANQAKSMFLAHMSHELRTPMNGVLGLLGVLEQTELDEAQRDFLATAHIAGEGLLGILNDILDLSRVEAGELVLGDEPFCLRTVVEDVAREVAIHTTGKDVEIVVSYPPGTPEHVVGDAGRVRQVLLNLATNAVKFTPRGHVALGVTGRLAGDGEASFRLSVVDTGIGIAPADEKRVFEKFQQVDGSSSRSYGGTGLGLTISRHLISLMGGTMGLRSTPGRGSEFWIELRMPHAPAAGQPPLAADLSGQRVLLVESHAAARGSEAELLSGWGAEVVACSSCTEALGRLQASRRGSDPFALLLVSVPGPGGVERDALAALRRCPALRDARLVTMLPAYGALARSLPSPEVSCIRKPIRRDELARLLLGASGRPPTGEAAPAVEAAPGAAADDHAPAGASAGARRVLVVEDHPINQKVILNMLAQLEYSADLAESGLEAVRRLEGEEPGYDLVLMDIQMPEMDGLEATTVIRSRETPRRPPIPIIALTAHAMAGDEQRFLDAGMDDYLPKPVRRRDLARVLSHYLG